MKIFPESWVPDPDKKFSPLDESLIDKIIAGVLKSDPKFEFIESKLDSNLRVLSLAKETNLDIRTFTLAFLAATNYASFEYITMR